MRLLELKIPPILTLLPVPLLPFLCDNYVTSMNAISEDGQLVNVAGKRAASPHIASGWKRYSTGKRTERSEREHNWDPTPSRWPPEASRLQRATATTSLHECSRGIDFDLEISAFVGNGQL
ncbi:MAG: hypothetical protein LBQ54_03715 [Planctomycetaceae bacterium]|nr:hypothetical protein [Planctomycetaceae bacterium]